MLYAKSSDPKSQCLGPKPPLHLLQVIARGIQRIIRSGAAQQGDGSFRSGGSPPGKEQEEKLWMNFFENPSGAGGWLGRARACPTPRACVRVRGCNASPPTFPLPLRRMARLQAAEAAGPGQAAPPRL